MFLLTPFVCFRITVFPVEIMHVIYSLTFLLLVYLSLVNLELVFSQVKRDFYNLLREHPEIDRHSRWGEAKKRLDSDPRYKSVDSSATREDWFREYQKVLKDERKRDKEKDRERRDKDRRERGEKEKEPKGENGSEVSCKVLTFIMFGW